MPLKWHVETRSGQTVASTYVATFTEIPDFGFFLASGWARHSEVKFGVVVGFATTEDGT